MVRLTNDFLIYKKIIIFAPLFTKKLNNEGSTASLFL